MKLENTALRERVTALEVAIGLLKKTIALLEEKLANIYKNQPVNRGEARVSAQPTQVKYTAISTP